MTHNNESGFTLGELLVATAIVSILAAFAIPQYAGYKSRAVDALMQSALRDGRSAIEAYYVQNGATYEGADLAALQEAGYSVYPDVALELDGITPDGYTLRACAEGGSHRSYVYDSTIGDTIGQSQECTGGGGSSMS